MPTNVQVSSEPPAPAPARRKMLLDLISVIAPVVELNSSGILSFLK